MFLNFFDFLSGDIETEDKKTWKKAPRTNNINLIFHQFVYSLVVLDCLARQENYK